MRIFLTGGTGYIGGALARRLAADGHELRCLVRTTSDLSGLEAIGAATFEGDVTDRYSMRRAMSGADWVIHAAAVIDLSSDSAAMARVNVEGSENVASLAAKLGVPRLLSISSMAVWGGSPDDGAPATEETPPNLPLPTAYSATKAAGEAAIRGWQERGMLDVVTVFPGMVYGPPGKREGANALLRAIAKGRLPAMVGGDRRVSWVYLDDLVEGVLAAMDRAEPAARYLMTGDDLPIRELARRVCEISGARPPRLELPLAVARVAARVLPPLYRLRGWRAPLGPAEVRSLARHWRFDDAKARRELGWERRNLAEGLPEAVRFLLAA